MNSRKRPSILGLGIRLRKPGVVLGSIVMTGLLTITVMAKSWRDIDWTKWTSQDVYQILEDSPWAVVGPEVTVSSTRSPGRTYETTYVPTAQMVSALVVRQALLRQTQLLRHYDKMASQEKQQFDQMAATCLGLKLDDRIVVRGIGPYTADSILPNLTVSGMTIHPLMAPQGNAISPCPYILGTEEAQKNAILPVDDLVFPSVVNGKSVIQAGDKKFKVGDFTFNAEKMVYKGKPDF
jgi:hypothetical protein